MRQLLLVATLCGCAPLLATAAHAAPTHSGPTGIVGTPTADVVGVRLYDVAVDYVEWAGYVDSWPMRVATGVSDKVEVSLGYAKWENSGSMKIVPLGVKAVAVPESQTSPAVALGAGYGKLKDSAISMKIMTLYAVATKTLSKAKDEYYDEGGTKGALRGSLGVMSNRYRGNGSSRTCTEPFASLEYIAPDGNTTLAFEYKTEEAILDPISSFVVRHVLTPNTWLQVGWTNVLYGTWAGPDHEFLIGLGYRWERETEGEWYD